MDLRSPSHHQLLQFGELCSCGMRSSAFKAHVCVLAAQHVTEALGCPQQGITGASAALARDFAILMPLPKLEQTAGGASP